MTKVLIALDYDPTAQKVAEAGFSLAKSMEAKVVLLHVKVDLIFYSSPEYYPIMGGGIGNVNIASLQLNDDVALKKASQDFLDRTKHHLGDETIETLVKDGNVADAILKTSKDLKIDIIVIGSHSHRWLEDILMGSVTEKVLRHTTIPLFIIPTKKINKIIKHLIK